MSRSFLLEGGPEDGHMVALPDGAWSYDVVGPAVPGGAVQYDRGSYMPGRDGVLVWDGWRCLWVW